MKKIVNGRLCDDDVFKIRAYGRTELAQCYCPAMTPGAAFDKLMVWINHYPGLIDRLASLGATRKQRMWTPAQVEAIVTALGEP